MLSPNLANHMPGRWLAGIPSISTSVSSGSLSDVVTSWLATF